MVTLAEALEVLYPNARPLVDYVVRDDGTGPRIADWSAALGAQPTAEQLAAVTAEQVEAARRAAEPDLRDFVDQAQARFDEIAAYLALPTPTAAQREAAFRDCLQWQRRLTRAMVRLTRRTWRA
jgi:hypothetical protein